MALVTTHVPRLSFSLDPLIAEAKRRMRQRRLLAAALVLAAAATGGFFALRGSNGSGEHVTASGRSYRGTWHGTSWQLTANDSGDGRYGVKVFTGGSLRATTSGRFYTPHLSEKLGWVTDSRGPDPPFVAGAVIEPSRHVTIRFSNGSVRTAATMPPTHLLAPGIAFFFMTKARAVYPIAITARDSAGHLIAAWERPG